MNLLPKVYSGKNIEPKLPITVDKCGNTPIMIYARNGNYDKVLEILNTEDVDLNYTNKYGNNIIHMSVFSGPRFERVVNLLLDRGADINCQNNVGLTPLFSVAMHGQFQWQDYC